MDRQSIHSLILDPLIDDERPANVFNALHSNSTVHR